MMTDWTLVAKWIGKGKGKESLGLQKASERPERTGGEASVRHAGSPAGRLVYHLKSGKVIKSHELSAYGNDPSTELTSILKVSVPTTRLTGAPQTTAQTIRTAKAKQQGAPRLKGGAALRPDGEVEILWTEHDYGKVRDGSKTRRGARVGGFRVQRRTSGDTGVRKTVQRLLNIQRPPTEASSSPSVDRGEGLAKRLGKAYSLMEVMSLTGATFNEVDQQLRSGSLFAVEVGSSHFFPLFQFDGPRVRPEVRDTVNALGEVDPWTVVLWLTSPGAEECGTPLERLAAGERDAVVARARQNAVGWGA